LVISIQVQKQALGVLLERETIGKSATAEELLEDRKEEKAYG